MTKPILILGCGDIGQRVARLLLPQTKVYGVRRDISRLDEGIIGIAADLNNDDLVPAFSSLPKALSSVIIISTPNQSGVNGYRSAYIERPERARVALELLEITYESVVFISSTSVYGQSDNEWVDEASTTEPKTATAEVLLEAETIAQEKWDATTLIIRSSGIYGKGRERFLQLTLDGVRYSQQPLHYSNRIHQDDLAAAIVWLLAQKTFENVYIVSDSMPSTLYDVQQWIIQQMGLSQSGEFKDLPTRSGSKRLNNSRLLKMGFTLQYPDYKAGYSSLIAQVKLN